MLCTITCYGNPNFVGSNIAGFGALGASRAGHGLAMVQEGGSGAGATFSHGPVSLSGGHFVAGEHTVRESEGVNDVAFPDITHCGRVRP